MINLLIAGYHGFGNCGDEAILLAMTTNIRAMAPDVDITALSYNPEFTKSEYKVKAVQRFNVAEVVRTIASSDIVLSGGGTLLQDGTSTRSLIYYLTIIKTAKLLRKRVMLYANGIGPVNGRLNRHLVKAVVNTVDMITLREKLSEADLRSIGVSKPNIIVTADPAFTLASVSDEQAEVYLQAEGIPRDKPLVGISVRNWSRAFGGEEYLDRMAQVCDRLIRSGKNVVFVPMEYSRDTEVSKGVMAKMEERAYLIANRYNPPQILGIVGRLDLMISMRLHTLIFAAVKNVPMLGIIYDPKVDYYLKVLEMPEAGDVRREHLDVDKIVNRTEDIFAHMDRYKSILKKNTDTMMDKAKENDILLNEQLDIIRKKV